MNEQRIVLDTNCLLQIISRYGRYRFIWDDFLQGKYRLCVTTDILDEYHEILTQQANSIIADNILQAITNSPYTDMVNSYYRFNIITADPDDNKFVDCAIAGRAKYLVSNDKHFNEVKQCSFPHVDVMTLEEFASILCG
ncbi:MAG: putative toxin-antitoxin system toxin component, PIN family [Bacteroidaceae bacterium]|nr:putative toxin-antitoxin system toxin component, PIN family [Bacteroidaceae bacterium]